MELESKANFSDHDSRKFETLSYASTLHRAEGMKRILEAYSIIVEIREHQSFNQMERDFDTTYLLQCPINQFERAAEILEEHDFPTVEPSEFYEFNRQHLIQEMDDQELIASVAKDHLIDPEFADAAEQELQRRGKYLTQEEIRQMRRKHESSVVEEHLSTAAQIGLILFALLLPPLGVIWAMMYPIAKTTAPDGSRHFAFGESTRRSSWIAVCIGLIGTAILIYITAQGW